MERKEIEEIIKQAKQQKARQTLIDIGILIPFDENIKLFHGRVNKSGDDFFVSNRFDNSGSKTGFHNTNAIAGLHTSSKEIAENYATVRTELFNNNGIKKGQKEIYKIVPLKSNLFIFDLCKLYDYDDPFMSDFLSSLNLSEDEIQKIKNDTLSEIEKQKMKQAVCDIASCYGVDYFIPKEYKNPFCKKIVFELEKICEKNKKNRTLAIVTDENMQEYIESKNFKNTRIEKVVENLTRITNSYHLLADEGDLENLINKYQSNYDFCEDCVISCGVIKKFLKQEHIVGVKQKIWTSKVINKNNFEETFFFNTKHLKADNQKEKTFNQEN